LDIKDIYQQYEGLAEYFKQVPESIQIVMCAGNHDALRLSEPQPPLDIKYAKALYDLPNTIMVRNPSVFNIGSTESFSGFNILLYHGFSMSWIADAVEEIRAGGRMERGDLIMKYFLQRRHLCPTHTFNLYVPDSKMDPLVIDSVPDFFVTGHIHRAMVSNYRGVSLINASCWVPQSEDNARRGIMPQPGRAIVVNLKTREVSVLNFCENE